jgi:hypothetical protein
MGLVALSRMMPLSKNQLLDLMHECIITSCGCHFQSFTISQDSFRKAVMDTMVEKKDTDIMDLLFIMWDLQGNHYIQYRDFLVGISPLACGPRDSLSSVLHYSLSLMDTPENGCISQFDLTKVLRAINTSASYLGDSVLKNSEIDGIVRSVFGGPLANVMKHEDVVYRLTMHPKVHKFLEGRGTNRYRPPAAKDMEQYHVRRTKRTSSKRVSSTPQLYEC